MGTSKPDEELVRRMVALAIEPYLNNDRKLRKLYRKAVIRQSEELTEKTALELLRLRQSVRTIQKFLADL